MLVAVFVAVFSACTGLLALDGTRLDTDRDGVDDRLDNCPTVYNPDQADRDGVGPGDACDTCPADRATHRDIDHDGIDDGCDLCIGAGPNGLDVDGDHIDDGCDPCVNGQSALAVDDDRDGIPDGCDSCVGFIGIDIDRDGIDDSCDTCLAGPPDDQDGDGIEDACDLCPVIASSDNTNSGDMDVIGDACDLRPTASDARLLFDGFRIDELSRWDSLGPGMSIAGDRLHVQNGDLAQIAVRTSVAGVKDDFQILARVIPVAGFVGISLTKGKPLLPTDLDVSCMVDSGGALVLTVGGVATSPITDPPLPAPPYIIALVGTAPLVMGGSQMFTCELRDPAAPLNAIVKAALQSSKLVGGQVGIAVADQAEIDWIEAIEATTFIVN